MGGAVRPSPQHSSADFQHLVTAVCACNRTRCSACGRSLPPCYNTSDHAGRRWQGVVCEQELHVDRNCMRTYGFLQALSHTALSGNRAAAGSKHRWVQEQWYAATGLYDHEQAFTGWCYWGPSSLPKSVSLCITY